MINSSLITLLFQKSAAISPPRTLSALVLLAVLLPGLLINLTSYPNVWLDEGFSLNAARTLATTGQYGTASVNGVRPFDPAISTGAPVIVPLALAFKVVGPGLGTARVVIALFSVAAAFALCAIAGRLYGRRDALLLVLFVLALPTIATRVSFIALGRQVMGENPALLLATVSLLLWWCSWTRSSAALALLAGVALGLALLTKLQIALTLFPTLLMIGALRARQDRSSLVRAWLPVGVALAVYAAWIIAGQLGTTEQFRADNRAVMLDGLRTNFLVAPGCRQLSTTALVMLLLNMTGVAGAVWRILRRPRGRRLVTPAAWAEATLLTLVLLGSVSAGVFSIGWERYIYGPFIFGLLLLGKLAWDLVRGAAQRVQIAEKHIFSLLAGALVVVALLVHTVPALHSDVTISAGLNQMIGYMAHSVPLGAVIETWDWELGALALQAAFHYPHQLVLQQTLRRYACYGEANLLYNALQADPDYLLQGPFSAWTGIYRPEMLAAHFEVVFSHGPYTLYQRLLAAPSAVRLLEDQLCRYRAASF